MLTELYDVRDLWIVRVAKCIAVRDTEWGTIWDFEKDSWYVATRKGGHRYCCGAESDFTCITKNILAKTDCWRLDIGEFHVKQIRSLACIADKCKLSLDDIIEIENKLNNKSLEEKNELNK